MLDLRNRTLAEVTRADDFIVSDRLVSLLVRRWPRNSRASNAVFAEAWFDEKGCGCCTLRPAAGSVDPGVEVTFPTIVGSARRRGEIAIGYRVVLETDEWTPSHGVRLNPPKSARVTLGARDAVIVVAP